MDAFNVEAVARFFGVYPSKVVGIVYQHGSLAVYYKAPDWTNPLAEEVVDLSVEMSPEEMKGYLLVSPVT